MATPSAQANLDDPVTRHMRTDCARLNVAQTVGEALTAIRDRPPGGRILYFYVVDDDNRLRGVVPTRRLLLGPLEQSLAQVMVHPVVAIPAHATVLEACEFFTLHRFLAFPIVDDEHRLIGVIDVELYTEELGDVERRERSDDLFQLIGVHLSESQQRSAWGAFCSRFPWLLCNLAGGILAAFLSGLFEAELKQAVALALFIPVVLALAESVSIQSVSLALQTLHGRTPSWAVLLDKLRREMVTGILLGAAAGLLAGLVALLWLRQPRVVWCLIGGIAGGVTCAAVLGIAMPTVLRMLRRDPAVAAGPIALAGSDMLTLLVYFSLARWLLG